MDIKVDYEWKDHRLKWPDNCHDDNTHPIESNYWYLLWQPHIHFHHLLKIEPVETWRPAESLTISKVSKYINDYFRSMAVDLTIYQFLCLVV